MFALSAIKYTSKNENVKKCNKMEKDVLKKSFWKVNRRFYGDTIGDPLSRRRKTKFRTADLPLQMTILSTIIT